MGEIFTYAVFIVAAFAILLAIAYSILRAVSFWVWLLLIVLTATGLITLEYWKDAIIVAISFAHSIVMGAAAKILGGG